MEKKSLGDLIRKKAEEKKVKEKEIKKLDPGKSSKPSSRSNSIKRRS